jgi:hypothetical protein
MRVSRFVWLALVCLGAVAVGVVVGPQIVEPISDLGRPEVTRLWRSDDETGWAFTCTASYIHPRIERSGVAWLVTASHCVTAGSDAVARNRAATAWALVNWRGALEAHTPPYTTRTVDIAIGTVPDLREPSRPLLWLAEQAPERGAAWVHGYPYGVERVVPGYVVPLGAGAEIAFTVRGLDPETGFPVPRRVTVGELFPGTRVMFVLAGSVQPGASGAPILDAGDRVIGILWGSIPAPAEGVPPGAQAVLFTPVERLHELLRAVREGG